MKLFEYLACERPVVSVPLAGIKFIAKDAIYYAETPEELREKIHYILTNKQAVLVKIQKGLALAQKYNWTELAQKYEQTLGQILMNFNK